MSKESNKIAEALENMSITFDELGFSPTIPIPKGDKAHFIDWFKFEIDEIKALSIRQDQRIAELEEENDSYQKLINDVCNKHRVGSLKELDEIYQATNESLYASREYLEELKSAKWKLEEQLKKSLESNNDLLNQIMELQSQLIKERMKGEKK